jgi:hypothetical protein
VKDEDGRYERAREVIDLGKKIQHEGIGTLDHLSTLLNFFTTPRKEGIMPTKCLPRSLNLPARRKQGALA